ncbi:hypothetical protein DAEQUDRAFT_518661 [Daedalea quercina L-15889]|uniref:F-box domain-containing protein n=1 Tax=Daedalea quercina L-15889 TaxID=1314783 RepID=A0A165ME34_9APHY|nr:hypothetical protein DAEQUDRAFT_518661 [Daedalea quercina L-15889]
MHLGARCTRWGVWGFDVTTRTGLAQSGRSRRRSDPSARPSVGFLVAITVLLVADLVCVVSNHSSPRRYIGGGEQPPRVLLPTGASLLQPGPSLRIPAFQFDAGMYLNALRSVLLADTSAEELATMSRADLSLWLRGREKVVEEYKRSLFSVKNSLLPVARLPTEVVVLIFVAPVQESLTSWYNHEHWVRVMHVCCRWRSIACTTPKLWATVTIHGKCGSYARECFERSHQLPLKVFIHSSSNNVAGILQRMLLPYEARIQLLCIQPKRGNEHDFGDNCLGVHLGNILPKLESLDISGICFSDAVVVKRFHSAQSPCLRQLVLRHMHNVPSYADLPGLKSLTLDNMLYYNTCVPPKRFVKFLRNLSNLEHLYMVSSVPSHTKTPLSPVTPPKASDSAMRWQACLFVPRAPTHRVPAHNTSRALGRNVRQP